MPAAIAISDDSPITLIDHRVALERRNEQVRRGQAAIAAMYQAQSVRRRARARRTTVIPHAPRRLQVERVREPAEHVDELLDLGVGVRGRELDAESDLARGTSGYAASVT